MAKMESNDVFLNGIDIIVTTKYVQNRKHKKKRINKKWAKKYGYSEINVQQDGEILFDREKRVIYCTHNDFQKIKDWVPRMVFDEHSINNDPYRYEPGEVNLEYTVDPYVNYCNDTYIKRVGW